MNAPREIDIVLGEIHVDRTPTVVRTLLGSCIAVCLFDPERAIGGMNHFMLPASEGSPRSHGDARYGEIAMRRLIEGLLGLGAGRSRLVAKVFGGGHVIGTPQSEHTVPRRNIEFTREYLSAQGIAVIAEDTGGTFARRVRFATHTGMAKVKRVEAVNEADLAAPQVRDEGKKSWFSRGTGIWQPPKS